MANALAKGYICELSASHNTPTHCPHCMSRIKQNDKEINISNIPTFLSEQVNCVKTVSHLVLKPQLTSYIVLNNIVKEFASEVPRDSLIRDDLLHHDDTDSETDGGEMSQDD